MFFRKTRRPVTRKNGLRRSLPLQQPQQRPTQTVFPSDGAPCFSQTTSQPEQQRPTTPYHTQSCATNYTPSTSSVSSNESAHYQSGSFVMQQPPTYEEATADYQPNPPPIPANPPPPAAHKPSANRQAPVGVVRPSTSNYQQEAVQNSRYPSAYGPMDGPNGDVPSRRSLLFCKNFFCKKFL